MTRSEFKKVVLALLLTLNATGCTLPMSTPMNYAKNVTTIYNGELIRRDMERSGRLPGNMGLLLQKSSDKEDFKKIDVVKSLYFAALDEGFVINKDHECIYFSSSTESLPVSQHNCNDLLVLRQNFESQNAEISELGMKIAEVRKMQVMYDGKMEKTGRAIEEATTKAQDLSIAVKDLESHIKSSDAQMFDKLKTLLGVIDDVKHAIGSINK